MRLDTLDDRDEDFKSNSFDVPKLLHRDDVNDVDEQIDIVSDPFFIGDM